MPLRNIVRVLGGDVYDGGRRANVPYPGHSRADRSLSLWLAGDRVVVTCFGEGDWKAALTYLREQGLVDGENRPTGASRTTLCEPRTVPPANPLRTAAALRLWTAGRDIAGSPAGLHLRLRHIQRALAGPDVARFLSETPLSAYRTDGRGPNRPALLLAIRNAAGDITGVEVTYLHPNGRRADDLRLPRKHIGRVPAGCAVRIDPAEPELLVAEGFFTALSASERFGLPAWALLSTRNLRAWSAPEGVRFVLIAGDNGVDGRRSAGILVERLEIQGVKTRLVFPDPPHGDWNDAATRVTCARCSG